MKRSIALFLSVIILFGAAASCTSAAGADTANGPSAAVITLEKAGGALGSLLGQLLKLVTFTDESRIKKASAGTTRTGTPSGASGSSPPRTG